MCSVQTPLSPGVTFVQPHPDNTFFQLTREAREISIQGGKGLGQIVDLSTSCKIGSWLNENDFFSLNNLAQSWLMTAHVMPSLSPCIKISLE